MRKTSLQKIATLFSSATLVVLFLLYRTGSFDNTSTSNNLQTSHNGGLVKSTILDTAKKSRPKPTMLSSSKTIILTDKTPSYWDSINKPKKKQSTLKETSILSSTKSAIIFSPKFDDNNINIDSLLKLKKDTIRNKRKQ